MTVELTEETLLKVLPPIRIPFVNTESTGEPGDVHWNNINGKPTLFPAAPHTHNQTDVDGLVSVINSLEDDITELETDFDYATNFEAYLTPGL